MEEYCTIADLYSDNIIDQLVNILHSIQHKNITLDTVVSELKKYNNTHELFKLLCDVWYMCFLGAKIVDLSDMFQRDSIDSHNLIDKYNINRLFDLDDSEEWGFEDRFAISYYYNEKKDIYKIYYNYINNEGESLYQNHTDILNKFINNKFINSTIGIQSLKLHCADYIKNRPELIKDKYVNRDIRKLVIN